LGFSKKNLILGLEYKADLTGWKFRQLSKPEYSLSILCKQIWN